MSSSKSSCPERTQPGMESCVWSKINRVDRSSKNTIIISWTMYSVRTNYFVIFLWFSGFPTKWILRKSLDTYRCTVAIWEQIQDSCIWWKWNPTKLKCHVIICSSPEFVISCSFLPEAFEKAGPLRRVTIFTSWHKAAFPALSEQSWWPKAFTKIKDQY